MAIKINSSLVPVELDYEGPVDSYVIDTEIPAGIQHPQWVNGAWQEYNSDNDPEVIRTKQYLQSFEE